MLIDLVDLCCIVVCCVTKSLCCVCTSKNDHTCVLARSVSNFLCYRLDKSAKISGLFCWDVYIIFFLLLQNLNPYFQNGGQKTKVAAKKRKTNITGLIIDLQSRVICQNVHCLNRYLI